MTICRLVWDTVWGDKQSERINGWIINQMTQFLQIAAVYGMKVIFALFDWSDSSPSRARRIQRTK